MGVYAPNFGYPAYNTQPLWPDVLQVAPIPPLPAYYPAYFKGAQTNGDSVHIRFGKAFTESQKKDPNCVPTPEALAGIMVELADITPGMRVLEPSAGTGNIADMILKQSGVRPSVVEWVPQLRQELHKKGYRVSGRDFMEHTQTYDRIIMNPPFYGLGRGETRLMAGKHLQHAYNLLKPGGKVVAIIPEINITGKLKDAKAFSEWLFDGNKAVETVELPQSIFRNNESRNKVKTRIVIITKPPRTTWVDRTTGEGRQLDLAA